MLRALPEKDLAEMTEPDGTIKVTCEYCSRVYPVLPESVDG